MKTKKLTIIIPIFNEEKNLKNLASLIKKNKKKIFVKPYSIEKSYLFVNDGSTDNSERILKKICDNRLIKFKSLKVNKGKAEALNLGIRSIKSDLVGFMDGDCQDDPKEINKLLKKMFKEKLDIVSGYRFKRKDSLLKKIVSKVYNRLINRLFNTNFKDINTGLKIFDKKIFKKISLEGNNHRFILILALIEGFKISEEKVISHKRYSGNSKYSLMRVDGILSLLNIFILKKNYNSPTIFFGNLSFYLGIISTIPLIYFFITQILFIFFPENFEEVTIRPMMIYSFGGLIISVIFFCFSLICEFIIYNVKRR